MDNRNKKQLFIKLKSCERCKYKTIYDTNPYSLLGRIWRWHINFCQKLKAFYTNQSEEGKTKLRAKNKKSPLHAYVLMRIFNDNSEGSKFRSRLKAAIESVSENKKNYHSGNTYLVLCDNSPLTGEEKEEHEKSIKDLCQSYGFSKELGNLEFFFSDVPCNSAYATYKVREKFLSLTEKDNSAFAISLDQDDVLEPNAVLYIAKKMTSWSVVLSPFSIINDGGEDITKDGGKVHNKLTKTIAHTLFSNYSLNRKGIYYASSLGWSKSFSRETLQLYQSSLTSFLEENRVSIKEYYGKHRAYEDFVDFYVLLRSDVIISATSNNTHKYYKHKESITCNPSIDDFRIHRTASLLTLIDLCYSFSDFLIKDFKPYLLRYISIKIADIEQILEGYRNDFLKGNDRLFAFSEKTSESYFIQNLFRLAQGEDEHWRRQQDMDLFNDAMPIRGKMTKTNFNDLFSCDNINRITDYSSNLKNVSTRYILQKVYRKEIEFRKSFENNWEKIKRMLITKEEEADNKIIYDNKLTPNEARVKLLLRIIYIIPIVFIGFMLFLYWEHDDYIKKAVNDMPTIITATTSALVALYLYLLNEYSKTEQ